MGKAKGKTKKMVIYEEKSTGSFFLRPTKCKDGRFSIKQHGGNIGKALGKGISDVELGKAIREQFRYCD